ncbi:splicing factor, variant 2 [Naganishia albida]|nr:splicing factor, variant 2 [Naganishia albida]
MGRMAEQQRKLLEQMMGPEAMGITQVNVDWWDPRVCRNFLCGTCPHEIFGNTKMDMGPCPKLHSDKIAKAFQEAKAANPLDPRFAAFEQEYQNNIYAFVDDCDRKIRMSQKRLEKTPEENRRTVDLMKEVGEIELAIQGQTEEIEQLGEAGKVEESMAKLEAVEALKSEKAEKERELQRLSETGGASGHQKLRVCETCGAYLSVLDSDRRLADHFGGKMHLGYHELRKLLEKFNEQRQAARMGMNGPRPIGGPPAPSAPRGPILGPPSGPSAPRMGGPPANNGFMAPPPPAFDQPMTPTGQIGLPVDMDREADSAIPGHGDKKRREAMELQQDSRHERSRDDDRERRRDRSRDRSDRYRDRSRERSRSRSPARRRFE